MAKVKLNIHKSAFCPVYYPYLQDHSHRWNIYVGGAGSGKSHFVFQKMLLRCLTEKRKYLVCRKVGVTLKDSCFALTKSLLIKWGIYSLVQINNTNYTMKFPNGSEILFKGLDDPEKIKSITDITDVICEECTEFTEEDVDQLNLRIRASVKESTVTMMLNPISKTSWIYKRYFAEDAVVPDDTFILSTTYKDNPFLPEAYVRSLENMIHTNETYYRIYALGEWTSLNKKVYTNWRVEKFELPAGDLLVGLDFGFVNDPTALVASILHEDKLYIFDEHYQRGMLNEDIAEMIKEHGFSKSVVIGDSAEPKSIQEIKKLGIGKIKASTKGKDSVRDGIQKLQAYEIIVHPKCTHIIEELENYTWKKDKYSGEYTNEPVDEFNHLLDALRYSLQCTKAKLRTVDKRCL